MFRRRTQTADEQVDTAPGADEAATSQGKGRPTPKRRDAERVSRGPYHAPTTRREAFQARSKGSGTRSGSTAARDRQAYMRAQDRGPARQLARDWVDSRRLVAEYFLFGSLGIVVLTLVPIAPLHNLLLLIFWPIAVIATVGDSVHTVRKVKQLVAEVLPDEPQRGHGMYAAMRAMQFRRFRMPPPQVKVGDKDKVGTTAKATD